MGRTGGGYVARSIVVDDFNGDGFVDLAAIVLDTCGDDVVMLLGDGDGTFASGRSFKASFSCNFSWGATTGDFNADGKLDLVVLSDDGLHVLLGNGDGSFRATSQGLPAFGAVATGDFDGDGALDLAAGVGEGLGVMLGKGDGTFAAPMNVPGFDPSPYAPDERIVVGDLNGDGRPDLVAGPDGSQGASCDVYLNRGDGTFQLSTKVAASGLLFSVAIGDLNGDGIPDLVFPGLSIFVGRGDGTFDGPTLYTAPDGDGIVALGALRGNGHNDIVASFNDVSVLLFRDCE